MTFELPPSIPTTAAELRELEQNAPNVTPKSIRAALVQAAAKLESYEKQSDYCIRLLNEALNLRTGVMDSESRAHENERRSKQAMQEVVERLSVRA